MRTLAQIIPSTYTAAEPVGATIGVASATVVAAPTAGKMRTLLASKTPTLATSYIFARMEGLQRPLPTVITSC